MSRSRSHDNAYAAPDLIALPIVRPPSDYRPAEDQPPASIVQLRTRVDLPAKATQCTIDVFLHYLKAEGVTHVFGIVGGLLYPFFVAIENDPELSLIHVKHEE